jgi:hypothetical protein
MKRALLAVVIVLLVAGFVRGWIALNGPQRQSETNKVDVNLTVDPGKMKEDAHRVKDEAKALGDEAREEIRDLTGKPAEDSESNKSAPDSE